MTLVEAIQNLTQIVTQMAQAQQSQQASGMTPEQSAQLTQMAADVVALKDQLGALNRSQQEVIGALNTHTEQLSGLSTQLQENGRADEALRASIGDLSMLGGVA